MSARDIGSLLFAHPDVVEVCVVSEPRQHAFVVLGPTPVVDKKGLTTYCLEHLLPGTDFQLTVLDELPHTRTGAVDRAALVDICRSTTEKHVA
jgi:acyl-coenzyme A synthetase/AMP-(fatty) acid ligase